MITLKGSKNKGFHDGSEPSMKQQGGLTRCLRMKTLRNLFSRSIDTSVDSGVSSPILSDEKCSRVVETGLVSVFSDAKMKSGLVLIAHWGMFVEPAHQLGNQCDQRNIDHRSQNQHGFVTHSLLKSTLNAIQFLQTELS